MSDTDALTLIDEANALLKEKDADGAFVLAKRYWQANQEDPQALLLMSRVVEQQGKKTLAKALKRLGSDDDAYEQDAKLWYEAGYHFITEREPALASLLLSRCAELAPDQADCRYELGFALMQSRDFAAAIPQFEWLLSRGDDFDNILNLVVCYSMVRKLGPAVELVKQLEKLCQSNEDRKEAGFRRVVLKRLEKLAAHEKLSVRDWVFSLYGAAILNGELSVAPVPDYSAVATMLLVLKGLLHALDLELDVVEFYNPVARPLAEALARLLDRPAEIYGGPDRKERTLLVMAWASDIVGPHKTFILNNPARMIFAYGLTPDDNLPVTPDMIGCLTSQPSMPWSTQLDEKDDAKSMSRTQAMACDKLLERASDLESQPQIIERVEKLTHYYLNKKELLVMANSAFAERQEYTAEIPL